MKTVVITQARMTSTRLPGKVLLPLCGKPALYQIYSRITRAKSVDEFYLATSVAESDDVIEAFANQYGIKCFRGSLDNVLSRYYHCAKEANADIVVRCTADNSLIDSNIIDEAIQTFISLGVDYIHYKNGLPLGMRIEVFSFPALERAYREATNSECLEHVTPYIINNTDIFKVVKYQDEITEDHSDMRFTTDTPEDYRFVTSIYEHFGNNTFTYEDILDFLKERPELLLINKDIPQVQVQYKGENS